jgi:divalent metal cation (Fe/Co/Zn/Cd) transporter
MQFVVIAIVVGSQAIDHLVNGVSPSEGLVLIVISIISMVLTIAIGAYKFYVSKKVRGTLK